MDPQTFAEINLAPTFGPIYWGFIISLFLGGMTIVQAYVYFPGQGDGTYIQTTAAAMLFLDLASSALTAQSVYYYLIPHYGSLAPLGSITPELSAECLISAIITAISQLYFVHQLVNVKRLGHGSWILIVAASFFLIVAFAGGVGCVVTMYKFHHSILSNREEVFSVLFGIAKGAGAITDILATLAMCLFLSSARTGMNATNGVLKSLMQFVIQRGALVTLVQILVLITFYTFPTKLIWFAFHVNVTKLYANTFFAMLNARSSWKKKHMQPTPAVSTFGSFQVYASKVFNPGSQDAGQAELGNPSGERAGNFHNKSLEMPTVTTTVFVSEL